MVASHALPWLETPDQAVVWGYALGLHEEVEDVLARSVEVAGTRAGAGAWFPSWYVGQGYTASPVGGSSGGAVGDVLVVGAAELRRAWARRCPPSAASPGSSGSGGGGGGFGGGGSGGGGGGAGGGF